MTQSIAQMLNLKPLHLPDTPSWWPPAWGWWGLVAAVVAIVLVVFVVLRWRKRRLAPKKAALKLLSREHYVLSPSEAIELLRQAALCYFSREDIARLTGNEWYAFLDEHLREPRFVPNQDRWQQVLYKKQKVDDQQALIDDCYVWVKDALPPKRRRKRR